MSDPDTNRAKERNVKIAENEEQRQVTGDVRVSAWAIAVAVVLGIVFFGWMLARR